VSERDSNSNNKPSFSYSALGKTQESNEALLHEKEVSGKPDSGEVGAMLHTEHLSFTCVLASGNTLQPSNPTGQI
jgi:hypothetical protein